MEHLGEHLLIAFAVSSFIQAVLSYRSFPVVLLIYLNENLSLTNGHIGMTENWLGWL